MKCMIVGRYCATMAVAVLFAEQESGEQVNRVVSSMHQACPLYAQLLTYRCGAANRRFGPGPDSCTATKSGRFNGAMLSLDDTSWRLLARAFSRLDEGRSGARQNNPEFGEVARLGVDLYGPAMLLDDDVVTDGQA